MGEWVAELHPLLGVPHHLAVDALHPCCAAGGERMPSAVEHLDGNGEATSDIAEAVVGGDAESLVRKLGLVP